MNYKKGLKLIKENTMCAGTFGYGATPAGVGQHGGDVGNSDFYAPGNAMNLFGDTDSKKKNKKKGKKRGGGLPMNVYRRTFAESTETDDMDYILDCVTVFRDSTECDVLKELLEQSSKEYIIEDKAIYFKGLDEEICSILENLEKVVTKKPFERGDISSFIGEFDADILTSPKKPFNEYDQVQLKKGTRVEMEHTSDSRLAKIIACNHLDEYPDYYEALEEMEKSLKKE